MRRIFLHASDAIPASIISFGVALALLPFFIHLSAWPLAALLTISFAARMIAPVHQHCHAHRKLFHARVLNDLYDLILLVAAGNTTAVWELQHVLGHHLTHLTPEQDPAAVSRFRTGKYQHLFFTLAGDFLSFTDSIAIARRQRNASRWLARLWLQQLFYLAFGFCLLLFNARLALLMIIGPNVLLRWMVFYISYTQHHGAPGGDVFSGSVTHFGWSNKLFLNVGHHTAHHEKPTLHWTKLPARTELIRHRIPASCLRGAA